jgi:hypothetical protein
MSRGKVNKSKGWGLVFPDGEIHPAWMYESKNLLKSTAPGEVLGTTQDWKALKDQGYKIARVDLVVKRVTSK